MGKATVWLLASTGWGERERERGRDGTCISSRHRKIMIREGFSSCFLFSLFLLHFCVFLLSAGMNSPSSPWLSAASIGVTDLLSQTIECAGALLGTGGHILSVAGPARLQYLAADSGLTVYLLVSALCLYETAGSSSALRRLLATVVWYSSSATEETFLFSYFFFLFSRMCLPRPWRAAVMDCDPEWVQRPFCFRCIRPIDFN